MLLMATVENSSNKRNKITLNNSAENKKSWKIRKPVDFFLFFPFDDTSTDQDHFLDNSTKFFHLTVLSV